MMSFKFVVYLLCCRISMHVLRCTIGAGQVGLGGGLGQHINEQREIQNYEPMLFCQHRRCSNTSLKL